MGPLTVILNEASGSVAGKRRDVESAINRAGVKAEIVGVRGPEIVGAAEGAARAGHALIAAGGDGTVSTVAAVAVKAGTTFGVMPLGTLNHFARDAGIPLDLEKAAATIAAGHTRVMDVGVLNEGMFVDNASLGVYPRLVWERQQERCRGRAKWTAFAIALVRTWRRYPTVVVHMTIDDIPLVRRTPFVFMGNGEYRAEGLGLGTRASMNGGMLSIYLAPGVGRFEFLRLPVRAVTGRLSDDVKFEAFRAFEVTIETAQHQVEVAMDGELRTVRTPLRCGVRRGALRTLVPAANEHSE